MSEPPDSQLSSSSGIFVDANGEKMRFHVAATGFSDRGKVVRQLRSLGASICKDPNDATYILVRSQSDSGRRYIREWQEKIVLEYNFVRKCSESNKFLGPDPEDGRYGGCIAVDDGRPIQTGEEDEEEGAAAHAEIPLPTPRQTPVNGTASTNGGTKRKRLPETSVASLQRVLSVPKQSTPAPPAPNSAHPLSQSQSDTFASLLNGVQLSQSPYQLSMAPSVQPQLTPELAAAIQAASNPFAHPNFLAALRDSCQLNQINQNALLLAMLQNAGLSQAMPNPALPSHNPPDASQSATGSHCQPDDGPKSPIFEDEDGESMKFYFQLDLRNRRALSEMLKRNGGSIAAIEKADYAVLSKKHSSFAQLLAQAEEAGAIPVKPQLIDDSVRESKFLDPYDYLWETSMPVRARTGSPVKKRRDSEPYSSTRIPRIKESIAQTQTARRSSLGSSLRNSGRGRVFAMSPESEEEDAAKPPPIKKRKSESASMKLTVSPKTLDPSLRSPTPPPMSSRMSIGGGKIFKYTEEEMECARRYVPVLIERNPDITLGAISERLHMKMDNHSARSWGQHIGRALANELEMARKRVGIKLRKQAREQAALQSEKPPPEDTSQQATASSNNIPVHATAASSSNDAATGMDQSTALSEASSGIQEPLVAEDLEVIVRFFAFEGGDAGDDDGHDEESKRQSEERTWQRLEAKAGCKSMGSWAEFYAIHHFEIEKRYQLATGGHVM